MNKKLIINSLILITGLLVSLSSLTAVPAQAKQLTVHNQDQSSIDETTNPEQLITLPAPTGIELSPAESAALLYMREEEKLAHDVYLTLFQKWGLPIFQNIATSEQTHTEAVRTLLIRYGLPDPASNQIGVFSNADLQAMYTKLIAQGELSAIEALKVGVTIEEVDIRDLENHLAETDQVDILRVYNNLLRGSYNHLNAFTRELELQTGETYQVLQGANPTGGFNVNNALGGIGRGGYQIGGFGQDFGRSARP